MVDSARRAGNVQIKRRKLKNIFVMGSGGVYMVTMLNRDKAEVPLCVPELEVSGGNCR